MRKPLYTKIVFIYLIVLLLMIQVFSILISYGKTNLLIYSYFLMGLGIIGLILYLIFKLKNKKLKIQDLAIILLAFYGYVSYVYSYDQKIALFGFLHRREGLLVILVYYVIMLVASTLNNKKYIKWLIYLISFNVICQIVYGLFQIFDVKMIFNIDIVYKWKYAFGFVGNSNFLSSLVVMMMGIWLGVFLFSDNNDLKNAIVLEIFLLGLVISGSMSAFVALIVMLLLIIIYLVYCMLRKKEWMFLLVKILIVIFLFIVNIGVLTITNKSTYFNDIIDLNKEASEVVNTGLDDEQGTGRIYIWRKTLEYLPKYLITGIGIDQFYYIGGKETIYDPYTGSPVDKAHNEYLQILVTEGIFKCVTYIIFLLWIFFKGIRKILKGRIDPIFIGLFLAFTGYAIQAFFNISVTRVAPIFYLIMGLVLVYTDDNVLECK